MYLGGKCVLVVSLVQGCSGLHRGSTAYVHTTLRMHVVSLHCRTPSITKNPPPLEMHTHQTKMS